MKYFTFLRGALVLVPLVCVLHIISCNMQEAVGSDSDTYYNNPPNHTQPSSTHSHTHTQKLSVRIREQSARLIRVLIEFLVHRDACNRRRHRQYIHTIRNMECGVHSNY